MGTPTIAPELVLETMLRQGLDALHADSTLIESLLQAYSPAERAEAVKFMTDNKVAVRIAWPPRGSTIKFPMVVIDTGADNEDPESDLIGDFAQMDSDEEVRSTAIEYTELSGISERSQYRIYVLSQDPRLTLFLYRLVKAIIILGWETFERMGLMNRVIGGGQSVAIDQSLMPEWAATKLITLAVQHFFLLGQPSELIAALRVTLTPIPPGSPDAGSGDET